MKPELPQEQERHLDSIAEGEPLRASLCLSCRSRLCVIGSDYCGVCLPNTLIPKAQTPSLTPVYYTDDTALGRLAAVGQLPRS